MRTNTAAEQALGMDLPSRRDEEWKWTDLRRMLDGYRQVTDQAGNEADVERLIAASPLSALKLPRIVLVNGKLVSAPEGILAIEPAPALQGTDPLLTMNNKLAAASISIGFSGNVSETVEVLHVSTGEQAIASRLHITLESGASATVVETHVGEGNYLHNPVTTVVLGEGAKLDRVKLEIAAHGSQHLSHFVATLGSSARLNDFTFTSGAALSRQNGDITFNGQHAAAHVSGSYLLKGKQHVDTRLVVDHAVPNCVSRELFKCVMDDNARGIFQGKVIVRQDAQKTDGKQSSHALLLSETAEFDAKPELEIYADDVVCGHGTTCGDLNHDHLFYLRSRGIPEQQARALLVEAFVGEAIDIVENEQVRDVLVALVHARMS